MMQIAFIGFGEAGGILARDLAARCRVVIWDIKLDGEEREAMLSKAQAAGVHAASSLREAVADASLVFSTVTASYAQEVAQQTAPLLHAQQTFLDLNSVAPDTKRRSAQSFTQARYIDVAVMAPVPPARLATPLLIGGRDGEALTAQLNALGLNARYGAEEVGRVSAIKMCRSVMIKGLEALTTECLSAARKYGVENEVLASLHASFPSLGWNGELPDYLISRVAEHGARRAAEVREVVSMLNDAGLEGWMSRGTVETQQQMVDKMAAQQIRYADLAPFHWQTLADKLN
ncbi:NAD(P)-dependent oxidoreductase [Franconibacter helveticus]|uniref:NAD(P)-dependent oxidoreductase n=1 Tax=Franconibacter helveticus TaxID=357240 RepID=UPI000AA86429|nr:NAD(P)-dependent oxidoreductase [Franconibacter helveticus]